MQKTCSKKTSILFNKKHLSRVYLEKARFVRVYILFLSCDKAIKMFIKRLTNFNKTLPKL